MSEYGAKADLREQGEAGYHRAEQDACCRAALDEGTGVVDESRNCEAQSELQVRSPFDDEREECGHDRHGVDT